jgi:hypothetical protein
MKKIIGRKIYDTTKAQKLCEYSFSNRSDHRFEFEALYKTKSGSFFLHGIGGAASKYAIQVGNNEFSGSEDIQIMDINEVLEWLEDNASRINLNDQLMQELEEYLECV